MGIQMTVSGSREFSAKLAMISPRIMDDGERTILRLTFDIASAIKAAYPAAGLNVRTGALKGSVMSGGVERSIGNITGRVLTGQGLPYAPVQEFGATITPTHGQYLAIPLEAAKTPAGVARFTPRQITSAGYDGSFIRNSIIFGTNGKTITPLFKLVRSVTIPARPFVIPTFLLWHETIREELSAVVGRAIK